MADDTEAVTALIVRDVCELTDLPDPADPDCLCVTVERLTAIVQQRLESRTPAPDADRAAKLEKVAEAAERFFRSPTTLDVAGMRQPDADLAEIKRALRAAGYLKDIDHG